MFVFSSPAKFDSTLEKELDALARTVFGNSMSSSPASFPKYNRYQLMDGNPYMTYMEFALAGYKKSDLEVKVKDGYLYLSGKADEDAKDREYVHRGMARRNFEVKYPIGRDVEVRSAEFKDGLLTISLETIIPDDKKPKSIEIY